LAASRVRAPYEARGDGDQASLRRFARILKEAGIALESLDDEIAGAPLMPRVSVSKSRAGFYHPAGKAEIKSVLEFFGARCFYGLQEIKLTQGHGISSAGKIMLGRLQVPGTIVLYDQAIPPWTISGMLSPAGQAIMQRADAKISVLDNNVQTLVDWSDNALKNFMLFEGLMHEIGHHLIQQYTGKRSARVVRTRDHERFAELFATRCREAFFASSEGSLDG